MGRDVYSVRDSDATGSGAELNVALTKETRALREAPHWRDTLQKYHVMIARALRFNQTMMASGRGPLQSTLELPNDDAISYAHLKGADLGLVTSATI